MTAGRTALRRGIFRRVIKKEGTCFVWPVTLAVSYGLLLALHLIKKGVERSFWIGSFVQGG